MPTPGNPPNRQPLAGRDGLVSSPWARWFTQIRDAVAGTSFYIPTTDGAPTDTPETRAGFVPARYDTTNERLYVYNGGWVSVTLS